MRESQDLIEMYLSPQVSGREDDAEMYFNGQFRPPSLSNHAVGALSCDTSHLDVINVGTRYPSTSRSMSVGVPPCQAENNHIAGNRHDQSTDWARPWRIAQLLPVVEQFQPCHGVEHSPHGGDGITSLCSSAWAVSVERPCSVRSVWRIETSTSHAAISWQYVFKWCFASRQ